MNLHERLVADLQQAMRVNDPVRKDAIRLVRAAIQNAEIEWKRPASDTEVQDFVLREVKRRHEAIELFRKGGREDLVAMEEQLLAVLLEYLPTQMSREQVTEVVRQIVADLGASGPSQTGPVMRQAMAQLKGKAEGRLVNDIVREVLSQ
ncbi:MAG: GatB/YqeY domain-containing protein [Anaerolineae bacterium]